ncbi:D-xylose transporter XylE [Natronoflexus pectinivorans]|uniref:SP family xylose:H+ symportor-like MFS transporter n=1 Tax=Natronoflexus pectinivorans TaxID=682526 RepID=A0A4R2G5T2_9BACT|nr:D-xylose transporter XylE [Natronoflexus pectinivorans]TCO03016.1 SP family xylose:H+ symportor-like MFS transporter [Natronoflexus pectinivorans]
MQNNGQNKLYVVGLTLVATLGGLLFGYDTAVISGAEGSLQVFFAHALGLNDFVHGITTSSALIGCVIGGALSGIFANRLGRKRALQLAAFLFFTSAIGSAYPEMFLFPFGEASVGLLVTFNMFRVLGGIGVGLASAICPMYIAEIAPANIRGRLVSLNQFAIIFGMLVVYFVNWGIAQGQPLEWINSIGWRWMFASEAIPAALFGTLLFLVPETPRYLALNREDDKAMSILTRINGRDRAQEIMTEIKSTVKVSAAKIFSYGKLVVIIGILLSVFQQFVGINVVLYYAPRIFQTMAGSATDVSMMQTVVMGVVNILFTVVAIMTVDKFGRKPLLIIGSIGMAIGMFAIGLMSYYQIIGIGTLIFIIVYSASFMMSWGPICWVLISEIFPNNIRGKAVAIAVAAQWIANFMVSSTFPFLISVNEAFTYGLYGVMSVISAIFVWKIVPETKGKTLEQMETLWKK